MLSSYIPDLEVEVWKRYCSDILPNCRYGLEIRMCMGGMRGFYLFEEGCFACIVEAKKEDRVLCRRELLMKGYERVKEVRQYLLCL